MQPIRRRQGDVVTKTQIKKLETILAKLETLEHEVKVGRVREYLHSGKNELLSALRASDK